MSAATETLILDVGWQPVGRVGFDKAVRLLAKQRAEVVDSHDRVIWSPATLRPDVVPVVGNATEEFRAPSVVRLLKAITYGPRRGIKFSRLNVWLRDKGRCGYCGTKVTLDSYTYDHVIPSSRGGRREWTNIICACVECNARKGGRTPFEAGMKLIAKPVRPTTLPQGVRPQIVWRRGMPDAWRAWLRDMTYWHDEMD